jgi:DNA-directed RNA polymerase specialized sigma24 family protein
MHNDTIIKAIKEEVGSVEQTKAFEYLKAYILQKFGEKVGDDALLKDLFQDRLMLTSRGLVCTNAKAYLYMIVRNEWLGYLRKQKKERGPKSFVDLIREVMELDPNDPGPDTEEDIEDEDNMEYNKLLGEPAPPDDPATKESMRSMLEMAINKLKPANEEFVRKYFLAVPPVALKDVQIKAKDSDTDFRNYENLKKLKQRTIVMLGKIIQNINKN